LNTSRTESRTLPEFDVLERALREEEALAGAAEAHGTVCGMLCARRAPEPAPWIEQVLGRNPAGPPQPAVDRLLLEVFEVSESQLDEGDFAFEVMLPGDDEAMRRRLIALRDWCAGFLFGFGSLVDADMDSLEAEQREFVTDLREFCRLEVEDSEGGEAAERNYTELVEYLRVGTLSGRQARLARPEQP